MITFLPQPPITAAACKTQVARDLLLSLRAIVLQARQGVVLERDACITQATAAILQAQIEWPGLELL